MNDHPYWFLFGTLVVIVTFVIFILAFTMRHPEERCNRD